MSDVYVHPNSYIHPASDNKSFIQKYLPQLNKIYERKSEQSPKKVVIFDLDETIGSFGDLHLLWNNLPPANGNASFRAILDIYPEFFRPGIFAVIEYIYKKIQKGISYPIHIYTNTQCDAPNWVDMILSYIENKIQGPRPDNIRGRLFADPICAFKIGGKRVNIKRTTQNKTPADFVRCSLIPKDAEICFVDDQTHEYMSTKKVYYIQPPPYRHPLSREIIMDRFFRSAVYANYFSYSDDNVRLSCQNSEPLRLFGNDYIRKKEVDEKIGKKIMFYVREFFLSELPPSQHTRKRISSNRKNHTRSKFR